MNLGEDIENFSASFDALESVRNRLHQIHLSLRKLMDQINHHNRHPSAVKFPNYNHIHSQFVVLLTQLQIVASNLERNSELLKSTNVYPLPSFPTSQQEGLVTTLLRKKPLPEVNEWINDALSTYESQNISISKVDELAEWCVAKVEELKGNYQFYGFNLEGIKEERANRNTIAAGKKALTANEALKFMYTGVV